MSDPVAEDTPGSMGGKPFINKKGGPSVTLLRLKAGEDLETAAARLALEGWVIPPIEQLEMGKDATSAFMRIKR
jgi:hypothetical protein